MGSLNPYAGADVQALGYLLLALAVSLGVIWPALKGLKHGHRRRALARELEATRQRNRYVDPVENGVRTARAREHARRVHAALYPELPEETARRDASQVRQLRLAVGGVVLVDRRPTAEELEQRLARARAEHRSLDDLRLGE